MDAARTRRRRRIEWADLEPVGVGEALREARERLGLTIEEAAEQTRIRPSHLIALEDEDFTPLPESVAGRGLLRTYATFLKLDAIELLGVLEARGRLPLGEAEIRRETRRPPPVQPVVPRLLGFAAAVVVVLGLIIFVASQYRAFVAKETSAAPVGAAASVALASTAAQMPTPHPTYTRVAASPTAKALASPSVVFASVPGQTARLESPTAARPSPTSVTTPTAPPEVVIEAKILADCWMRVEVDDKASFEGTLAAKERRTWRGGKVTIQVANAAAIEIIHNGTPLGKLGAAGQARTVTWTR